MAIIGASGYSGEELVRILSEHPGVEIACVTSRQHEGEKLTQVYPRFAKKPRLETIRFIGGKIEEVVATGAKTAILALPHGLAAEFAIPLLEAGLRVIDLSADFRMRSLDVYQEFYPEKHQAPEWLEKAVYGMPELYREKIKDARLIASPGCYPTSVILPLVPFLRAGVCSTQGIVVNSLSGVSGAGKKASVDFSYVECNENVKAYGIPKHRHLSEIEQELGIAAGKPLIINFFPHLIPLNRGILTTTRVEWTGGDADPGEILREVYGDEPFIRLLDGDLTPNVKWVVQTNFVDIAWRLDKRTGSLVLMSAEDNLTKGASGQAIQSLNICLGLDETTGLLG